MKNDMRAGRIKISGERELIYS